MNNRQQDVLCGDVPIAEIDGFPFGKIKYLLRPWRKDDLVIPAKEVVVLHAPYLIRDIVNELMKVDATRYHGLIGYALFEFGKTDQQMISVQKVVAQRTGGLLSHPHSLLSAFCQVCPVHERCLRSRLGGMTPKGPDPRISASALVYRTLGFRQTTDCGGDRLSSRFDLSIHHM